MNHCVCDGRSGFILLNSFFTLATDLNLIVTSEPINNEILPFISEIIPRPKGPFYRLKSFIVKQFFKRQQYQQLEPRIPVKLIPHLDCEPSKSDIQRYKSKFLFASSSVDLYSNLHEQCHLQQVTLNGPLFGCLLLALHRCFPLDDSTRLKPFEIGIAFDMRARLPQSGLTSSSVGHFIMGSGIKLSQSLSIQSTRFWSLAHRCMTSTRKRLKLRSVPFMLNVFTDLFERESDFDRFTRLFPDGRQIEMAFSNIGKYPFSCEYNQGEVRLRGLHVINNESFFRASTTMFVTCAGDGQLDFSLAHEMESDEKAQEFLDYYIRLIETCAHKKFCNTETTLDQLLKLVESQQTLHIGAAWI
jgi:hypothetical protein